MPTYLKTALSGWVSRAIFIACKFLMIPLLLQHLSKESYVALAILGSLEGWFLLLDFGVGISIQTYLSEYRAKGFSDLGFLKIAFLLGLVFFMFGILLISSVLPFLSSFFLEGILPLNERMPFFFLSSLFLLVSAEGAIASKILMARQLGYIVHAMQAVSSILSLGFLLFLVSLGKLSLFFAAVILFGFPAVVSIGLSMVVFSKIQWKVKIDRDVLKNVTLRARGFFIFSSLAALVTLSDTVIVPKILALDAIIEYNLLCKIFGVASFAYAAVLQGVFPEFTESLTLGRFKEVMRRLRYFCFLGVLGVIFFAGAVYAFSDLSKGFLKISLSAFSILAFGFYLCIRVVSDFHAMALQSHSKLFSFFFLVPIQAGLSLVLQYVLGSRFGIVGILLGLSLSYLLTVFWALPWQLRRRAREVRAF